MGGAGAVLTKQEIEQLKGELESVMTTLQEKEKARLKEAKVSGNGNLFIPLPLHPLHLQCSSTPNIATPMHCWLHMALG